MALETTLSEITGRLRQGRFPNEQAISQGIVLRLLQELEWDTWDTALVWPEYLTGEGRADFALCCPPSKPAIFIEVKQPGKAEDAVRQALERAFHTGVPFVVLTDGKTWSFYLPAEQGSYEGRRVYKLDLFERPLAEATEALSRYLTRARIESGEAVEMARKEYRSRHRRSHARAAIPEAWSELVGKGNEGLVELLASAVELKAGVRPDSNDVAEFLVRRGPRRRNRLGGKRENLPVTLLGDTYWIMNLDQLRYFVAVARAGTFTRAAEQEGITQPSLSEQMQKLEDSLGVSLFERHSRSVLLTPAGKRLLPQARSLLRQVVNAAQSISELKNRICGRLIIGVIPTVMPYWFAPRVASYRSRYPDVDLQIVENTTSRLVEDLETGGLEIAIISLPAASSNIVCRELFHEKLFFVLPSAHRFAALRQIEPRKLAGEQLLVLREGHCFRRDTLAACRRGLREPGTVFESDQFSSIFALVACGFGITVAPRMALPEAAGCRHISIDGGPSRRIGYARIRRKHVPPAQKAFIAWLRELCR